MISQTTMTGVVVVLFFTIMSGFSSQTQLESAKEAL
jgi:hypothetical protein